MKNLFFIVILTFLCISCEKDEFDVENPNVEKFVEQIKAGTYDNYVKGKNGELLWLIMPKFNKNHIQSLINFSKDTTHIKDYPLNPISSRTPYPFERNYGILGECLLWTVEGIRNDSEFGSLDPFLIDTTRIENDIYKGLNGSEILNVWEIYNNWWNSYNQTDWKTKNPLEETSYIWF